jgi:hypothetical protein
LVLSVADEYSTIGVDPDTVRARKLRLQWIAIQGVARLARAGHEFDGAVRHIEPADRMVLGIRQIHISVTRDSDIFWTRQGCILGSAIVAAETLLPCADHMPDDTGGKIESQHLVAFTGHEPQISGSVRGQRAWSVQRCPSDRSTVRRCSANGSRGGLAATVAHIGFAGSIVKVELRVGDVQRTLDVVLQEPEYRNLALRVNQRVVVYLRDRQLAGRAVVQASLRGL